MSNIVFIIIGIMLLGIITLAVYNVVVRKRKVNNMYTPFDDATSGITDEDKHNHQ